MVDFECETHFITTTVLSLKIHFGILVDSDRVIHLLRMDVSLLTINWFALGDSIRAIHLKITVEYDSSIHFTMLGV